MILLAMIGFTILANLLLKTGATAGNAEQGQIAQLLNWRVFLGLFCFALAAGCYVAVLRWLPLNVAVSLAAAQYIGVILAARWLLSEPIESGQWIGIALIALGISIIGYVQH
jgi:undecaprenyl phosphate-alpha-L-ara4N flippase subunit ArnE